MHKIQISKDRPLYKYIKEIQSSQIFFSPFDLQKFIGEWFEIAFTSTFYGELLYNSTLKVQEKLKSSVTDTIVQSDNVFEEYMIIEAGNKGSPNGTIVSNAGLLRKYCKSDHKFKIIFQNSFTLNLNVIEFDQFYQWIALGTKDKKDVWILSKHPIMEKFLVDLIMRSLDQQGYDIFKIILANQNISYKQKIESRQSIDSRISNQNQNISNISINFDQNYNKQISHLNNIRLRKKYRISKQNYEKFVNQLNERNQIFEQNVILADDSLNYLKNSNEIQEQRFNTPYEQEKCSQESPQDKTLQQIVQTISKNDINPELLDELSNQQSTEEQIKMQGVIQGQENQLNQNEDIVVEQQNQIYEQDNIQFQQDQVENSGENLQYQFQSVQQINEIDSEQQNHDNFNFYENSNQTPQSTDLIQDQNDNIKLEVSKQENTENFVNQENQNLTQDSLLSQNYLEQHKEQIRNSYQEIKLNCSTQLSNGQNEIYNLEIKQETQLLIIEQSQQLIQPDLKQQNIKCNNESTITLQRLYEKDNVQTDLNQEILPQVQQLDEVNNLISENTLPQQPEILIDKHLDEQQSQLNPEDKFKISEKQEQKQDLSDSINNQQNSVEQINCQEYQTQLQNQNLDFVPKSTVDTSLNNEYQCETLNNTDTQLDLHDVNNTTQVLSSAVIQQKDEKFNS